MFEALEQQRLQGNAHALLELFRVFVERLDRIALADGGTISVEDI